MKPHLKILVSGVLIAPILFSISYVRGLPGPFELLTTGVSGSYVYSNTVAELGAKSEVIVVGRVLAVEAGRTIGAPEGDPAGLHMAVLQFAVEDVVKGQGKAKVSVGDVLYIEHFRSPTVPEESLALAFQQVDMRSMVFLESEEWFALPPSAQEYGRGKGRPTGSELYRLSSVQGMVVES